MATKKQHKRTIKGKRNKASLSLIKNKYIVIVAILIFAIIGALMFQMSKASSGWELYWSDEFNGSSLDTSTWKPYNNTYGDGNFETHCLQPKNIQVSNGTLRINTKQESVKCPSYGKNSGWATPYRNYTSGFLGTRETQTYFPKYARYEVKAKSPQRRGIVPAIWLRHINGSSTMELDLMESFQGSSPGTVTSTIHAQNYDGVFKYNNWKSTSSIGVEPGWHVWAVEIDPINDNEVEIRYYLDGKLLVKNGGGSSFRIGGQGKKNTFDNIGNDGFDIALNTAVNFNHSGNAMPDSQDWYCPSNNWQKVTTPSAAQPTWKVAETPMKNADGSTFYRACTTPQIIKQGGIANNPQLETFEIDYVRVYTKSDNSSQQPEEPAEPETPAEEPQQLAIPSNIQAKSGNKQISLTWNTVSDANNYTVRWREVGGNWDYSNNPGKSGNPKTNSYTITELKDGTIYEISIAARNSNSSIQGSSYSSPIRGQTQAVATTKPDTEKPSTPARLRASLEFNFSSFKYDLALAWDASTDNVGVVGYDILKNGKHMDATEKLYFIDTSNLQINTSYVYAVRARDKTGNVSGYVNIGAKPICFLWMCSLQ